MCLLLKVDGILGIFQRGIEVSCRSIFGRGFLIFSRSVGIWANDWQIICMSSVWSGVLYCAISFSDFAWIEFLGSDAICP